jgi:nucleoside-diphosphate-sugar epimerase
MNQIINIKNKKIAIIGATGFIGGRLFEILKQHGINPLVILRSFSKAARLSRYKYDDLLCDLNNYEQLSQALTNVDICFNCAHDFTASQNDMLQSMRNLGKACIKNNVKLVHLSSVAVHEPMNDAVINEDSKICEKNNFYGYTKFLIEQELLKLHNENNLNVIILRPTNVYGPFSGAWTIGPCTKLMTGKIIMTDSAKSSINNLIYVDDVCNFMIMAGIKNVEAGGKVFLINGPDSNISWSKFYNDYSKVIKSNSPEYISEEVIVKNNKNFIKFLINGIKNISMFEDNFLTSFILKSLKKLPNSFKSKLKIFQKSVSSKLGETVYYPNNKEITDYKNKSFVDSNKSRLTFDYVPEFSYKHGFKKTSEFIKWYFEKSNIS